MATFVRRPLLSLGLMVYGMPDETDPESVLMGRQVCSPGVKVVAGLWRPTVYSPAQAEVVQIEFDQQAGHYVILLDDLAHQHRVAGIHVPCVREGDSLIAGEPLGTALGFCPKVSLQESSGRYWAPGKVREPRSIGRGDALWDSRHQRNIRRLQAAISKRRESYS